MSRIGGSKPVVRVGALPLLRTCEFLVPIATKSINSTLREHWRARAARNAAHRAATALVFPRIARNVLGSGAWPACVVTMTRIGRELDDDNLAGALKAVRDELAKQLGVDDRDRRIAFMCKQRSGSEAGVEVKLERVQPAQEG